MADKKVAAVKATIYTSSSWHSWRERDYMLKRGDSYLFDPKDVLDAILEDAKEHFIKPLDAQKAKEDLLNGRAYKEVIPGSDEEPDAETTLEKDGDEISVSKTGSLISFDLSYHIYESAEDDMRYLAVRQFICAPKVDPLVQRTEFKCTPFLEQAKKDLASIIPMDASHRGRFLEEEDTIIVCPKSWFKKDEWYQEEQKINLLRDKEPQKFFDAYIPWRELHLKAMNGEAQS